MDILNLLKELKRERGLGILLITHDLASARYLAERVLVLFRGRVVEAGPTSAVVDSPAHPYTRALLEAIADADVRDSVEPDMRQPTELSDTPADGCPFAPRCPDVTNTCHTSEPSPREVDGKLVRCHLYPEIDDSREDRA
jgi:peptide/nickel transport system ATP-binding protein